MKKLTIIVALAAAALATAGMSRHPGNPLTMAGKAVAPPSSIPFPPCPPDCSPGVK
jgi:hypothetical protein